MWCLTKHHDSTVDILADHRHFPCGKAPKQAQKILSYIIGWLVLLGWQVGLASVCYLTALQVQGLVILRDPTFAFENWHAALMTIAVALTAVFFNTALVRLLPFLESIMLVLRKYTSRKYPVFF